MPEPPGSLAVEDPPCCSAGSNRVVFCDELHVGERDPARRRRRTAPTRIVELPKGCKQEQASFTGVLGVGESRTFSYYSEYIIFQDGDIWSIFRRRKISVFVGMEGKMLSSERLVLRRASKKKGF